MAKKKNEIGCGLGIFAFLLGSWLGLAKSSKKY